MKFSRQMGLLYWKYDPNNPNAWFYIPSHKVTEEQWTWVEFRDETDPLKKKERLEKYISAVADAIRKEHG